MRLYNNICVEEKANVLYNNMSALFVFKSFNAILTMLVITTKVTYTAYRYLHNNEENIYTLNTTTEL